jgi:hypothetical protein
MNAYVKTLYTYVRTMDTHVRKDFRAKGLSEYKTKSKVKHTQTHSTSPKSGNTTGVLVM